MEYNDIMRNFTNWYRRRVGQMRTQIFNSSGVQELILQVKIRQAENAKYLEEHAKPEAEYTEAEQAERKSKFDKNVKENDQVFKTLKSKMADLDKEMEKLRVPGN